MSQFEPRPFGKYFLTDRIAIGGMAEIYKAKTFGVDGFEKTLAIKKILHHYSTDKDFVTMLTDEAKLVVHLSHPNIVQIYDLGRVGDDYFISMEFIDGVNLRELINRGQELNEKLPTDVCLYIAAEICKGLDYAHAKRGPDGKPLNIVHRDVSPHNILVSFEGEVKIVDFGIAKAALNASHTENGALKGKVTYMSPEQAVGRPIDARADIFSSGIVLFEMLTFERLFTGDSQLEVLNLIRSTRLTPDSLQKKAKIDNHAIKILARALAYNVRDRYPSAADMQIELTRTLYANFPNFTPRKLSDLLARWYGLAARREDSVSLPSYEAESILAQSSRDQINLVHSKAADNDLFLPETLRAGEAIAEQFKNKSMAGKKVEPQGDAVHEVTQKGPAAAKTGTVRRFSPVRLLLTLLIITGIAFAGYVAKDMIFHAEQRPAGKGSTRVRLVSVPAGAEIYLDDQKTGLVTPALLKTLKIGQGYELMLLKEGFRPLVTNFMIESSSPAPFRFELSRENSKVYTLTVRSDPKGAEILLDGESTNRRTPADFHDMLPGKKYRIEIKNPGYRPYVSEVVNQNPRDQIMDVSLIKMQAGSFVLTSDPPGAEILMNGKSTGFVTPHTVQDVPFHRIVEFKFRKPGFDDAVETVGMTAEGEKKVHVMLKAASGT